jgi:HD-GYP domain-containing protein (c-di-GMP phosphodiesterase class II)
VQPDDRVQLSEALMDAELRRMPFSLILRFIGAGETYYYETNGAVVTNADGTYRHVLVFCADVTPIVNAKLEVQRKHREVDEKNYQLSAALRQVEHSLHTVVKTMVRAVEVKDPYTAGHSERVRQYCVWMGEHFGLSAYEMRILSYGALIHDVGKIGIPDEVLTKPGKLTEDEFDLVKLHSVHGANIVADIEMFRDCVPIVRWHHERLDGSGYPDGIAGDEIPFLVRVAAVADVFDAMTSDRAYRLCVTAEEALAVMAAEVAEGKLDAMAFAALKAVIERHGMADLDVIRGQRRAA